MLGFVPLHKTFEATQLYFVVRTQPTGRVARLRWSKHLETVMSTKHLRLTIDFPMSIADTPENDELDPLAPDYHARRARLLAPVKKRAQVLTLGCVI
jgi:hypothetical protein